ncbi:hypothetical protein ACFSJ3_03580 [Corallincola platygyrae]|uniref:PEP-CTERM sorting domain-containing protein n=1 Tax=Corallincola platygyrae TaxID=1193278 RepID=A0ABW4XK42_9GAMM
MKTKLLTAGSLVYALLSPSTMAGVIDLTLHSPGAIQEVQVSPDFSEDWHLVPEKSKDVSFEITEINDFEYSFVDWGNSQYHMSRFDVEMSASEFPLTNELFAFLPEHLNQYPLVFQNSADISYSVNFYGLETRPENPSQHRYLDLKIINRGTHFHLEEFAADDWESTEVEVEIMHSIEFDLSNLNSDLLYPYEWELRNLVDSLDEVPVQNILARQSVDFSERICRSYGPYNLECVNNQRGYSATYSNVDLLNSEWNDNHYPPNRDVPVTPSLALLGFALFGLKRKSA